ncbi:MAG TPA: hypothetical protein VK737_04690 [Opitutales bacterium]|jgi:hypothetical protein|nr:hypothetical protein [Opitutales bacterium]
MCACLLCGCTTLYYVDVTPPHYKDVPVIEIDSTLDAFLAEKGFKDFSLPSRYQQYVGAVAAWEWSDGKGNFWTGPNVVSVQERKFNGKTEIVVM